ncbi:MAG: cold shock domain-containing protein [Bacteroidales bacterium]|nr:cold shock domain-containing protein [Bacteroidales bacterium]
MEIGLIEWFNDSKGFGILKTPDNNEVFLHISNWKDPQKLATSNRIPIVFDKIFQKNKSAAINCTYFNPENQNHWEKVFSLTEYSYSIIINYTQYNILVLVLSKLDTDTDYTFIRRFFSNILDNLTYDDLFNRDNVIYKVYRNTENKQARVNILELVSSKVKKLNDQEIIKFWRDNIVSEFTPDQNILTKCYKEISISDLKKIQNTETRNLLILRKLNSLNQDFNAKEYSDFQNILDFIDSEKFKNKVVSDLNRIADTNFLSFVTKDIIKLTQEASTNYYRLNNFLKELPSFLSNVFIEKLATILKAKIIENCSFRTITDCWKGDFIKELDDSILNNLKNQNNEDLLYLLNCKKCNENIAKTILDIFLSEQKFSLVLEEAKKIDSKLFDKYDRLVWESATEHQYFDLWKNKMAFTTPFEYISKYLNHQEERYSELTQWLNSEIISKEEVVKLLTKGIKETTIINDRYNFYRVFFAVKNLIVVEPNFQENIDSMDNDFVSLILWHFKKKDSFNFDTLKGKFIYFRPVDQVYIFKRLFYLKHKGKIEFDLNKLDEILRADIDLHLSNEKLNDDFVLDISTHIIIECLKSFVKTNSFVFESELILRDLQKNRKKKFKIEKYFELCEGRQTADWNWKTEGKISQVYFNGENGVKDYYAISFDRKNDVEAQNYSGSYTNFGKNPNFEHLLEQLKKIPKRKWNDNEKHWGVPSRYKEEVYVFAKENKFFIELNDKRHYDNNIHLVEFTRDVKDRMKNTFEKNIPNGITFCEGRKANKEHSKLKKEFWWCSNQECFQNCVVGHLLETPDSDNAKDAWDEYTLFDFLKILNINVDEHNGLDFIKDGHYYKFLGHINAFNRLLEHLYCEECGNLLYPVNSSHFALYRDVRFHCIDENCSQKHKEIYLNNCLYGECKSIIDSRISKRCNHGLFICPNCGTCCSEELFRRRLESLKEVGGYIHNELIENVKNQNGHLEKGEYYCYSCSGMMKEISDKNYECLKCHVTYDLEKFKWLNKKWTQTHRRRKDYPVYSSSDYDDYY